MSLLLTQPRESLVFEVLQPTIAGDGTIELRYRISGADDSLSFTERVRLPGPPAGWEPPPTLLRLLSLAASLSYYKTCIPATVRVEAGLTATERDFLAEVLRNGLGEFAFRNGVPQALHPEIDAPPVPEESRSDVSKGETKRVLVAVGGGKDSIVTIESIRKLPVEVSLFSVNEYEPITATAKAAGLDLLVARRQLDPLLFELNAAGALNGHVPVTAINSLIGCLLASARGFDAVVFSNEASASAGNTVWEGVDVNHQWSKGIEFEQLLRSAIVGVPLSYFSFLRPLTELAIMRRFAELTEYHPVFTSCNRAFHLDAGKRRAWCGDCPKCRFVFLCLAPFISRDALLAIFGGRDVLADPAQLEGFLELLNVGNRMKPFECVGEPGECRSALTLLTRREDWADHPFFSAIELGEVLVTDAQIESAFVFSDAHFLPAEFEKAAREVL